MTVTAEPFRTTRPCTNPPCKERLFAIVEEKFLPARSLGGWVWTDAPLRSMSFRAKYYNQDTPDHSGEPIVFVDCPFCGGALPFPLDDEWRIEGEDGG